jgi:hypothetical protein
MLDHLHMDRYAKICDYWSLERQQRGGLILESAREYENSVPRRREEVW